jgi:TolA-binding protein
VNPSSFIDGRRLLSRLRAGVILLFFLAGCGAQSAKSHYLLAEKLYLEDEYAAAVTQFEKVIRKEPRTKLGLQALYRAATIQTLYLNQQAEAARRFSEFVAASNDPGLAWEARKQLGEIFFSKLENYRGVIPVYRSMLADRPGSEEAPELLFRIGRSQFLLRRFDEAIQSYEELTKTYSSSRWAERALYEIGVTHFTRAGLSSPDTSVKDDGIEMAMAIFRLFMRKYPRSPLVAEVRFGLANCLEELDQLDAATQQLEAIRGSYPSPQVIAVKLDRIRERKAQRNR